MCRSLGLATTAEGVETLEQLDCLAAEGVSEMQGYLFGRPLPADEARQLLCASPAAPAAHGRMRRGGYRPLLAAANS
ncbi:MAG: EAL domain-containing protein [Pseudomonadota bacterium]|nr:EAL domain-containing protein [Pseudomonadota bacterium]